MRATQKEKDIVHVKQYVTDAKGHKMAAILDIKELARVHELLEDLADLKVIEERVYELVIKNSAKKELDDIPAAQFLKIDAAILSLNTSRSFPFKTSE
ncbi:MAG: hypothetical protein Q8P28_01690 [Deltaproteobacteria bacterium]|nr:hypothetical protein [Deltaproteobacteria bacterium]